MLFLEIQNQIDQKYNNLFNYIFDSCNQVSFHLPNFLNTGSENIKLDNTGNLNQEYVSYLKKNQKLIDLCFKNKAKKYISKEYNDTILGYNTQIITVKLFSELKNLIKNKHIFEWTFPNLPEDLCFFSNGICKVQTIAHEEQFIIYNETKEDIDFLRSQNFVFFKIKE